MLIDVEVIGVNYTDVQTRSGAMRQFRIIRLIDMRFLLPLLGLFFLARGDVEVPESIAPAQLNPQEVLTQRTFNKVAKRPCVALNVRFSELLVS